MAWVAGRELVSRVVADQGSDCALLPEAPSEMLRPADGLRS
jgi:hypothetical protein